MLIQKTYWNPLGKEILYFHVIGTRTNHYIKVDVVNKRVYKAQLEQVGVYKFFKRGVYELKWSTFITGTIWGLKPCNIASRKKWEAKDGIQREKIKHTSENAWQEAVNEIVKQII